MFDGGYELVDFGLFFLQISRLSSFVALRNLLRAEDELAPGRAALDVDVVLGLHFGINFKGLDRVCEITNLFLHDVEHACRFV